MDIRLKVPRFLISDELVNLVKLVNLVNLVNLINLMQVLQIPFRVQIAVRKQSTHSPQFSLLGQIVISISHPLP